jgi:magnesium and cobalt transporter
MGDIIEGSSIAAHSAHSDDDNKGFFSRIFGGGKADTSPPLIKQMETANLPTGDLRNLYTMRVEDVAVPRADINAVPMHISLPDLITVFRDTGNTRLPVYVETLDQPKGFIHLKDVALKHGFNGGTSDFDMEQMLRPILFAPPSMKIGVLLQKMQADHIHMALVIDEYGGVDGLVTIEDLVEQVLGDISDEHDKADDAHWHEERPGVYLVQARTPLTEFEHFLGTTLLDDPEEEEIDTLGGLVFMLVGRVPAKGEIIPHPSGYEFEIVDADPRRIKRMRVCRSDAS